MEAELAQHLVALCGGLQLLAQLMEDALAAASAPPGAPLPRMTLLKALVGLIRNVALNIQNDAPLRELGFIQRLVQVLMRMQHIYAQKVASPFLLTILEHLLAPCFSFCDHSLCTVRSQRSAAYAYRIYSACTLYSVLVHYIAKFAYGACFSSTRMVSPPTPTTTTTPPPPPPCSPLYYSITLK